MKLSKTVKLYVISAACAVIVTVGLVAPQRAHAYWGIFDTDFDAWNLGESITEYAGEVARWAEEDLMKSLRDQVVKAVVNEINKQTVSWIQGNGSPRFVTDWQGFLKDAGMEAVNQTISQSQLADLCTPFAFQLRVALIPETQTISKRAKCSISDIVANVDDFYKNFQNGGWLAYGASIKPENNLYMQLVMFDDETKIRSNFNQEKKKQEAGAGSGFLSVTKCLETDTDSLYDECIADASKGGPPSQADISYCEDFALQASSCTKEQVQTPGDAVAGTVRNLIGSDNIYVSGVQSIISAAINAGINRMMSEGLSLMTGNENPQRGFNPSTQFRDQIDTVSGGGKRTLIDQVKPYYDQWTELVNQKNLAATYNDQIKTNLSTIQTMQSAGAQCPPLVNVSEIAAITTRGAQLSAELVPLRVKLSDAQTAIDKVNTADMLKIRDSANANNAVRDFLAKYNAEPLVSNPTSSYPQQLQAARDQTTALKNELDLVLTRLQTCRSAQTAASPAQ